MSWRLRCAALLLCLSFALPSLGAAGPDADLAELQHYTLNMDKVTRVMQTMSDLVKLAKADPKIAPALETDADKHESLADIDKRLSANPGIVSAIKQHGFTTREFVVAQFTIFQSAFAAAAKESGADPAKLASDARVNPANITFMEQHKSDFEQLQKQYGLNQSSD